MAGLSLSTGIRAGANYSPMTPAAATPPTARNTIAQAAYGINGSGANYGPRTAGYGSVGVGLVSIGLLIFIWWSLPR